MGLEKEKLGDSGRTGFFGFSESEIQLLDPVIPVRGAFIQLIGFDPLVDGRFVIHPGQLCRPDPGDGMIHHLILEVLIEQMDLVVVHQDTAVIEAILHAHQDLYLIRAGVDVEVLAVTEFSAAKQMVKKKSQVILLIQHVGEFVKVAEIGLKVRLDGNGELQVSVHFRTFGFLNIGKASESNK